MFDKFGNDSNRYNIDNYEFIAKTSPKVAELIKGEYERQRDNIELIASENYCSEAVLAACGSCLSWKYAEGYPYERTSGNKGRYYGGTKFVDELEEYCCDKWREVFNTDYHVNVQPHSGSQANFSSYKVLVSPGDTVLAMSLDNGGHLTHGASVNFSGKLYNVVFYDVDENGIIDMDDVRNKAEEYKPKMILAGASAYARRIDFKAFADIAKSVDAYFMVDMAHIAGLVAAGEHESPFGHADIVTTTTHKTLRGPRGGLILGKKEYEKAINKAVFPGIQGGPLQHIIASKAVCFKEALGEDFKNYQKQVLKNSQALAKYFLEKDYDVITKGTDNHLILINLANKNITGKEAQDKLDLANITLNKNSVPFDTQNFIKTGGVRIGSPAVTTRGMKEDDIIYWEKKLKYH